MFELCGITGVLGGIYEYGPCLRGYLLYYFRDNGGNGITKIGVLYILCKNTVDQLRLGGYGTLQGISGNFISQEPGLQVEDQRLGFF